MPHGQIETLTSFLKIEISNSNGHFVLTYVIFYGLPGALAPPRAIRKVRQTSDLGAPAYFADLCA